MKRDIVKLYPDVRKLFETLEIKIGKDFTYKDCNNLLYHKLLKNSDWKDIPLIKKINIGFICPDDEWRSKLCQFVYEELSTIFDFTEDLNKLHNFIKTASWSLPIALFTHSSINIVNTVCSIASYYGVGLEVLRTDYQQSVKGRDGYYRNREVNRYTDYDREGVVEAAGVKEEEREEMMVTGEKGNLERMFKKDELEIDDKQIT